jgi:hypothetical protein
MSVPLRSVLIVIALLGLTGHVAAASDSGTPTVIERGTLQADTDVQIQCYADESDRPDRPGIAPPTEAHGNAGPYFRSLWSGDPDYPTLNESDRVGADDLAPMSTCRYDRVFKQPPEADTWNEPEQQSYPAGDRDFAARPAAASWESGGGGRITHAYVEIFSTTPSTVVHQRERTQRFVAPDGTVRALVDYRLPEPEDSGDTSRRISDHAVESELYVDGTRVDSSTEDRPVLEYSDLSGTAELRVESTVQVTIRERTVTVTCRTVNGSQVCSTDVDIDYEDYSHTVSDSRTVRVQDLSGFNVDGGAGTIHEPGAPDNETVVGVSISGMWRSIQSDAGYRVHNEWRYYTRTDEYWTEWATSGDAPGDEFDGIRPLEVHAVPVTAEPEVTRWQLGEQSGEGELEPDIHANVTRPTMAPQPPLPPEINISRAPESPTDDHLRIWSGSSLRNTGEFQVNGLVRGHSATHSVPTAELTPIREVNITATVVSESADQTELKVLVQTQAGDPVEQGQLTVTSREASVQRSLSGTGGELVVTLPHDEYETSQIAYEPAELFWQQSGDAAVRETTVPDHVEPDFWEFSKILELIVVTVLWFLPLGLLLYGMDVLTNGRLLQWVNP